MNFSSFINCLTHISWSHIYIYIPTEIVFWYIADSALFVSLLKRIAQITAGVKANIRRPPDFNNIIDNSRPTDGAGTSHSTFNKILLPD